MNIWSAIIGGISLGLFMAISVGPTIFAIIRYSISHSYKAGIAFVLGVSVSDIMYVTLANLMAPVMERLSAYDEALAYGGGGVLMIMGIAGFLKKQKPQEEQMQKNVTITNSKYMSIWLGGFLINTLNPGVIINWLAAVKLITKAVENYTTTQSVIYRLIFFGVCLVLVLGIDFLKVFLADKIRHWLTHRRIMLLNKISALCLFFIGLIIVLFTIYGMRLGE